MMGEQSDSDSGYRDLIAKGRARVGEPPSPETLVAYSRGELSESEAEQVRESLAYYPDLAEALAEDEQQVAAASYLSKAQLDADWLSLQQRLNVRSMPSRSSSRPWRLATAASILLAIISAGMWWKIGSDLRRPHAGIERIEVFDDGARGPGGSAKVIRPGPAVRYLLLTLTLAAPITTDTFRAEILHLAMTPPRVIWSGAISRSRDGTFTIEVPRVFLPQGAYRINLYGGEQSEPMATYLVNVIDG